MKAAAPNALKRLISWLDRSKFNYNDYCTYPDRQYPTKQLDPNKSKILDQQAAEMIESGHMPF